MAEGNVKRVFPKDHLADFHEFKPPDPSRTGLLIIDVQQVATSRGYGTAEYLKRSGRLEELEWRYERIDRVMLPNIRTLLRFFHENRLLVIFITLGSETGDYSDLCPPLARALRATNNRVGSPEHEIADSIKPEEGDIVLNKVTFGAFASTPLDRVLHEHGIKFLVICGLATSNCVESTAREAVDRGYDCTLIEDACVDTMEFYHDLGIAVFGRMFGHIQSTKAILSALETSLSTPGR